MNPAPPSRHHDRANERETMLEDQVRARGIEDQSVLAAMRKVPRHRFVPQAMAAHAYEDRALPIGHDVTISQPSVVAFMIQAVDVQPGDKVLDVGTGSGYQAAVLAEMGARVYGVEIVEPLVRRARAVLTERGYLGPDAATHVEVHHGDGYRGLPNRGPFDAIIVAAAAPRVPEPLVEQLAAGGRMIVPVGEGPQRLVLLERTEHGVERRDVLDVAFVPMTGEVRQP